MYFLVLKKPHSIQHKHQWLSLGIMSILHGATRTKKWDCITDLILHVECSSKLYWSYKRRYCWWFWYWHPQKPYHRVGTFYKWEWPKRYIYVNTLHKRKYLENSIHIKTPNLHYHVLREILLPGSLLQSGETALYILNQAEPKTRFCRSSFRSRNSTLRQLHTFYLFCLLCHT